ncbi:MAG: hypothetical protein IT198_07310 [Acidimicrobiia bacterium]|nr:hypothetical protein [Acidimicrobiia bacterium]
MSAGVGAAVGAAILYNLAVVVQKYEAEQTRAHGVRIVLALARRPVWLLGIALQMAGFGLHVFAFTRAPVMIVQAIIGAGIVCVVAFAWVVLHEIPGRQEIAGIALSVTGVVLLVLTIGEEAGIEPVSWVALAVSVAVLGSVVATAIGASRAHGRRGGGTGVAVGLAAGVAFGSSDTMNRLMGAWLSPNGGWQPPFLMGVTAAVLLFCFGFVGFVTTQNALKVHRANRVVPSIQVPNMLVPVVMATVLYGQPLPDGALATVTRLVGLALVVFGIVVLASSERVAATFAEDELEAVGELEEQP